MAVKQILIVVAIVVMVEGWCCHACFEDERIALLQLKASFINSSLPLAESLDYYWGKSANCCSWVRIECDSVSGHVTLLDLSNYWDQRQSISIPTLLNTSLFLPFKQLNSLDLFGNNIIDCVKNEGFEKLAQLKNLEFLDLSYNNFNNSILSSLNTLSPLKLLYLSHNSMKGIMNLAELSNLINLETLNLAANEIQDFTFSNGGEAKQTLSKLKYLDLAFNQLKESLNVKDLSDLKNLEALDLSGNEISKFMASKDISRPSNLSTMYLDGITINGKSILLQSLEAFPYLRTLSLESSDLRGARFGLGAFPNLRSLHLEYSYLRGARFGSESYNFTNLEELFLNQSSLDANFLQSLSLLPSLKILSLSQLNGSLPIEVISDSELGEVMSHRLKNLWSLLQRI